MGGERVQELDQHKIFLNKLNRKGDIGNRAIVFEIIRVEAGLLSSLYMYICEG